MPPVASTSSCTITRVPLVIASVHLEPVGAVLELIGRLDRLPGSLPGLRARHEAAAEVVRQRATEDEAPRLGPEDDVGPPRPRPLGEAVDRLPEYAASATSGIRSLKTIPGGKVRDVADAVAQVELPPRSPREPIQPAQEGHPQRLMPLARKP